MGASRMKFLTRYHEMRGVKFDPGESDGATSKVGRVRRSDDGASRSVQRRQLS